MDIKTTFQHDMMFIELARPHVANAMDESMLIALLNVLKTHTQSQIRALVLSGQGKHFCAGADIEWMKRAKQFDLQENIADAAILADCLHALANFHAPVISVVHGACYGGGIGLVACSDIVIADASAQFCFSEAKLGLIPVTISPYIIDAIGPRMAKKLFLTAEKFSAHDAMAYGLVHEVVDAHQIDSAQHKTIEAILKNGPQALSQIKTLINDVHHHREDNESKLAERLAKIRISSEAQQGLEAFMKKKPAPWIRT